jgi:hypothetical protein
LICLPPCGYNTISVRFYPYSSRIRIWSITQINLSPKVCPLSIEALNITSSFPVLLVHHAT